MLRLLTDENLNGTIIRGLLHRHPKVDLVRVQDVGLIEMDDPAILAWAAEHNRILLTHDRATIPDFAYNRLIAGHRMPGVFVLNDQISIRQAIDELILLDKLTEQEEWEDQIVYLPL